MKVAVFVNAAAGGAGAVTREEVERLFQAAEISAHIHVLAEDGLESHVERALRLPLDAVVAAGGDGTISTVAAKLAGSGVPLGILPLGTRNHFAKDLGIPLDLREAVDCIARGTPHPVDVAEVNGELFINNSSIGAYPRIVEEREAQRIRRGLPKWLGNLVGFLKVLRRWPLMRVKLEFNGDVLTRTTPFVFVGNNEYVFNPRKERFRERLHAGELCVFTLHARSFWSLIRLFWLSLRNRLNDALEFESHFTRELIIHSHRGHLRVSRDGEVCRLQTPLHYRIRPGELLVFTPQGLRPRAAERFDEGDRAHLGPALRS
jgi:diacylglycerol kinase family enzyme